MKGLLTTHINTISKICLSGGWGVWKDISESRNPKVYSADHDNQLNFLVSNTEEHFWKSPQNRYFTTVCES